MPMLHIPCGDSRANHPTPGSWQGGGIYAGIPSIRTVAGRIKHGPGPDRLHCWLCTRPGYSHNGISHTELTTKIPSLGTLTWYYRMAAVFWRNDFKRNSGSIATVLCGQWFPDEFGQIVLWTHHTAAGYHTQSVVILELYGAWSGLWNNCNC